MSVQQASAKNPLATSPDQRGQRLTLSVIIATRNRPVELRACLESLMQQTCLPDEIIIVDASDTSDTANMVEKVRDRSDVPIAHVVSSPGLTRQRNVGIARSTGDVILFLDDDVVLSEQYVAELLKVYDQDRDGRVGGASGLAVNEYRKPTWQERLFLLPCYAAGCLLPSGFPTYHQDKESVQRVEVLPGHNMSFRAQVFRELGGFDEWFTGYSYQEDDDMSYRVSRRYQLLQVPTATLIHKRTPTARQPSFQDGYMKTFNHYYVFVKHLSSKRSNWIAFFWSEIGRLFLATFALGSLRGMLASLLGLRAWRNRQEILGRLQAHRDAIRMVLRRGTIEQVQG